MTTATQLDLTATATEITVVRTTEKSKTTFTLEVVDGKLLPKTVATSPIPYNIIKLALKHQLRDEFSNKVFNKFIDDMKAYERAVGLSVFADSRMDVSVKGRTLKDGRKSYTGRASEKKMKAKDYKAAFELLSDKEQEKLKKSILGL